MESRLYRRPRVSYPDPKGRSRARRQRERGGPRSRIRPVFCCILPTVSRSRRALACALALLVAVPFVATAAAEREEEEVPILERGIAFLVAEGRRVPIAYSTTPMGPLVELAPIVARLGGDLVIGPVQQSHFLTVLENEARFGPEGDVLSIGEELVKLSQAPLVPEDQGIQVPIDLIDRIYGQAMAYQFSWDGRELIAQRQRSRQFQPSIQLVHLQGVTTVVLQFPAKPRYRVLHREGLVEVEMAGDSLVQPERIPPSGDTLVRRIVVDDDRVRIALVAGAVAEDYVLDTPFRIVFDVHRGGPRAATPTDRPIARQRDLPGIRTIVIDPGHGGSDYGASGPSGMAEKDLVLMLARALSRDLTARLPVRVVLTRESDVELPLANRTAIANQNKADLFISIHLNSSVGSRAHGAETYFLSLQASDEEAALRAAAENQAAGGATGDPLNDLDLILWDLAQSHHLSASQSLAKLVQEELNSTLGLRNRGVKQAPFRVLRGAAMPAILVELGFLSNPTEERQLQEPGYQESLTGALVRAISRYRERVEADNPASADTFR